MTAATLWPAGLVVLAGLLQATWLPAWPLDGEWADLMLVTVVLLALQGGARPGLVAGLVAGLIQGLGAGRAPVAFLVSYLAAAAAVVRLRQSWQVESLLIQIAVVLGGTVLEMLLFGLLYPELFTRSDLWDHLAVRGALNAVAVIPLSLIYRRLPIPKARVLE